MKKSLLLCALLCFGAIKTAGADVLVIGRPITRAADPAGAAREIAASLDGAASDGHAA